MNIGRVMKAFALSLSLGVCVGACPGGDDDNKPGVDAGTTPGGTTPGGTIPGSGVPSSMMGGMACPSGSQQGSCTAAESKAYGDCIITKCDSQYSMCLGSGYKTGTFGGPCGTWMTCQSKCGCNDSACVTACGQPPAACSTCIQSLSSCVLNSGCQIPTCAGGGGAGGAGGGAGGAGGGAGGTCADLARCCASVTNAGVKMACDAQYNTLKGAGDFACGQVLNVYKMQNLCK